MEQPRQWRGGHTLFSDWFYDNILSDGIGAVMPTSCDVKPAGEPSNRFVIYIGQKIANEILSSG